MKRQLQRLGQLGLVLLVLALGVAAGVALDRRVLTVYALPDNTRAPFDARLLTEAWNTIQRSYVDHAAVQPQQLTYAAISGMVDALGDTGHSRFLTPDMLKAEHNLTQGEFEGIGVEVQTKDNHLVIVAPIDGSPAQQAGLRAGDAILQVNGEDITGLPLEQAIGRILGPAGTPVTLTVLESSSGRTREVKLVRARIALHNVTWQRLPGTTVAHVRIAAFSQGVSKELQTALKDIRQQGITAILLDLRNNPGGLLDESVNTASQFLSSGNVLEEKNAQGQITPVPVKPGGLATDLPMVVLTNGGTASAAEITAGALQDAHRATLIGETTFGTGTVLNEFKLSDGSALLLATEEWLTPAGRVIWHKGIAPDVAVSLPAGVSPVLPEAEQGMTADQLQTSGDDQLLRALDLLVYPREKQ
jgi:carboxyl-terminal processing protease